LKKRILVLSEFTYLNNFIKKSEIIYDIHLVSELLSKKYDVYVIDSGIGDLTNIKNWENDYANFTNVSRAFDNLSVLYKSEQYDQRFFFFNNYIKFFYFSFSRFLFVYKTFKEVKPDMVISYSIFRLGLSGLFFSFLFRKKYYFRFIDMLVYFKKSFFLKALGFFIEFIILNLSDKIFVLSKDYQRYVRSRCFNKSKVRIIPFFCKASKSVNVIKDLSKNKKIKLVFVGVLYDYSGIYELIHAYNPEVFDKYKLQVNIYGDGPDLDRCLKLVKLRNLSNVFKFHGFCTFNDIPRKIIKNDFCINTMLDQKEKSLIFNAKIVQYLANNRNVISIHRGNINVSFPEKKSGVFYVKNHRDIFLKSLKLYNNKTHLNNKIPYDFYNKNFSPHAIEKSLLKLIQ
jgi:glycosyltransferase involved in cell wall biosynthesis